MKTLKLFHNNILINDDETLSEMDFIKHPVIKVTGLSEMGSAAFASVTSP